MINLQFELQTRPDPESSYPHASKVQTIDDPALVRRLLMVVANYEEEQAVIAALTSMAGEAGVSLEDALRDMDEESAE